MSRDSMARAYASTTVLISAGALAAFAFAALGVIAFAPLVFGWGAVGGGTFVVAVVFGAAPFAGAFPVTCGAAGVILGGGGDTVDVAA